MKIKKEVFFIIYSVFIFISGYYFCFLKVESVINKNDIEVKQIEGEKIYHDKIIRYKDRIIFKTIAEGKGVIKTSIKIPEKKNAIVYSAQYTEKFYNNFIYYRKWKSIYVGGGIATGFDKIYGLTVSVLYIF